MHSSTDEASWRNLDASTELTSWINRRALREKNKNLRRVYAEAKMDYGADVLQEEELTLRKDIAFNLRQCQVKKVMERMQAARKLDLCFLVDATWSMGKHIQGVKDSIRGIVDTLTTGNSAMPTRTAATTIGPIVKKIRLAFVGYRDFYKANDQINPGAFEVLDFTDSVDTFHKFCSAVHTENGFDWPEDVFGGLEKVNSIAWTTDGSTRVLFHIADAPCHGKEFHADDCRNDRYPKGDPKGRSLSKLLGQLSDRNIDYYFGKITNYTDKMVDKFSAIYRGGISTFDISKTERIHDSVVELTSIAVTRAGPSTRGNPYKGPFSVAEPNWRLLPILDGLLFSYELPESILAVIANRPLMPKRPNKAKLKLAQSPFAHGVERVAYYGRDVTDPNNPLDIVLKKYTSDTGFNNSVLHYEMAIQMQTIASFLAQEFGDQMKKKPIYATEFLKSHVFSYTMAGEGAANVVYMSCERRYPASCQFLRFTNNANYALLERTAESNGVDAKFVRYMVAFSHWTYQVTEGYLMVVDLQGVIHSGEKTVFLTDPAIHCTDLTRFGQTNFGQDGMKCFFGCHQCNEFCKELGLVFPVELVKDSGYF